MQVARARGLGSKREVTGVVITLRGLVEVELVENVAPEVGPDAAKSDSNPGLDVVGGAFKNLCLRRGGRDVGGCVKSADRMFNPSGAEDMPEEVDEV